MKTAIETSGDLRKFLVNMMLGVKDGHVDVQRARAVIGLAAAANENVYAEIKQARTQVDIHKTTPPPFGTMPIGNPDVTA